MATPVIVQGTVLHGFAICSKIVPFTCSPIGLHFLPGYAGSPAHCSWVLLVQLTPACMLLPLDRSRIIRRIAWIRVLAAAHLPGKTAFQLAPCVMSLWKSEKP